MTSLKILTSILHNNLWLTLTMITILLLLIFFFLTRKRNSENYTDADYFENYEPVAAQELVAKKLDTRSFKLAEIDRTEITTDEFKDEDKALKGILTDFVNQEFLSDNKNIFMMLESEIL